MIEPLLDPEGVVRLREALCGHEYTSTGIANRIGAEATTALRRNDLRAALRATVDHDPLNTLIRLGKEGLTDNVVKETARALHDHELIKVKGVGGDREARDALFDTLAERTGSALVHRIGNVAVLYRPRPDLKRILIPD